MSIGNGASLVENVNVTRGDVQQRSFVALLTESRVDASDSEGESSPGLEGT
jgi:hypothetical protein